MHLFKLKPAVEVRAGELTAKQVDVASWPTAQRTIVDRDTKPANEPPSTLPPKPRRVIPTGSNCFVEDLDADAYHADPCEQPSLSASLAKVLNRKSARHAYLDHPRLGGGTPDEPTNALAKGTLLHGLLFGEADRFEVVVADKYTTKDARRRRDDAKSRGLIPVLEHDFDTAMETATRLLEQIREKGYDFAGRSELSAFWTEELQNGQIIQCRSRMDHVNERRGAIQILDVKSCASAALDDCVKQIDNLDYCIQESAYVRAAERIRPECAGRVSFTFLFCELPKCIVTPLTLDGAFKHVGKTRWERALRIWARCRETGLWPDYGAQVASPKPWTLNREEERRDTEAE